MKLYLIPTPIGESDQYCQPPLNRQVINELDYFVVENIRTARRFLARLKLDRTIDEMTFVELNEHTAPEEVEAMLKPMLEQNRNCGILSEAGVPCIADPGALLVAAAHRHNIEVVPLVGASSIILALMASGANGQSFAFNGYLPVKQPDRSKTIKHFEKRAVVEHQTQIFIETPYRNDNLLKDMLQTLMPTTNLTIAVGLNTYNQMIVSKSVVQWRKSELPAIGKRPAIFIIGG